MPFWKFMTVAEHERIMDQLRDLVGDRASQRDAETRRANALAAELDHWKKYGQLRDPATGRLIPKNAGKTPVGGE